MKISDNQIQGAIHSFVRQVKNGTHKPAAGKPTPDPAVDRVNLSPAAEELQAVKKNVLSLPDIRIEKVESIKAAIEAGEYRVSAGEIAEKMLGRSIDDKLK